MVFQYHLGVICAFCAFNHLCSYQSHFWAIIDIFPYAMMVGAVQAVHLELLPTVFVYFWLALAVVKQFDWMIMIYFVTGWNKTVFISKNYFCRDGFFHLVAKTCQPWCLQMAPKGWQGRSGGDTTSVASCSLSPTIQMKWTTWSPPIGPHLATNLMPPLW